MRLFVKIFLILLIPSIVLAGSGVLEKAKPFIPTIQELYKQYWNDVQFKHIPCGQVEQESSWNPKARLHTSREDGYGLGQITIAYDKNHKVRFNNFLTAIKYQGLKKWDWKKDPYNPKYQLTFLILQDRDNYNQVKHLFRNDEERFKGLLVSYNAGFGRVLKRRQAAIARHYQADTWTNGLEDVHSESENMILYGRPLWKAVNEYPRVIFQRSEKYKIFFSN